MKRPVLLRLADMLEAIETAEGVLETLDYQEFRADRARRYSIERCIEIVSEASRHIPEPLKQQYPEIPWREIAAIGNLIRHDYRRLDDRILWKTATRSLRDLKLVVIRMRSSQNGD
jgi:uncharacterized protein with HEPN domain